MWSFQSVDRKVRQLAFSPDGRYLAVIYEDFNGFTLLDLIRDEQQDRDLSTDAFYFPSSLAWSPRENYLALGNRQGEIRLYAEGQNALPNVYLARESFTASAPIMAMAFSPTEMLLASGSRELKLFDLENDSSHYLGSESRFIDCLAFSPDGRFLVTSDLRPGVISQWDLVTRKETVLESAGVVDLTFLPGSNKLLMARSQSILLVDMTTGEVEQRFTSGQTCVVQLSCSPEGRRIASAGWDGTVKIWDLGLQREIRAFDWKVHRARAISFSPDGMTIAVGGEHGKVVIWDVDD